MANSFKRYISTNVGTKPVVTYATPLGTKMIMIGCVLTNVATSTVAATVKLNRAHLVKNVPLPVNGTLSVLDGKIVLEAGDSIVISCDTADGIDAVISILEQN